MEWSDDEICRNYTNAKNKKQQINVLAQLNDCDIEEIKRILMDGGCLNPMAQDEAPAAVVVPYVPDIVVEALREKQLKIMETLTEIAEETKRLRKREDELTGQYKDINDYLAGIVGR